MIKNKKFLFTAFVLVLSLLAPELSASATQLSRASVRLDRLGTSVANNTALVTFQLNTTPTSVAKITVTFPISSAFTITTGTPTPGTTGFPNTPSTPTAITAPPGTLTGASTAGTGKVVISGLTSASLNSTTLYGFTIPTGVITNPSATGQYNVTVESDNAGGTPIDTTTTPVFITTSGTADQIGVKASVAPNFSFSLGATTDTIPPIDPTAIQTSPGVNMTVGTNSPLGYTAYVRSLNNALLSPSETLTPINGNTTFNGTPDTIAAGSTEYGFVPSTGTACSSCTGSLTYDGEYAVSDGTHVGAFNGTNFASFVSRNGYTNADVISLQERAAIDNTIASASDFADTLTIVAAGNF